MIQALRSICLILLVFLSTTIMNGCAKHAQVSQPVSPAAAGDKTETQKIIVAKVNNVGLSMDQLVRMMNSLPKKIGSSPESFYDRKMRALDSIILRELAYQRARAQGIRIEDDKIDLAIGNFKASFGDEKEYEKYLSTNNLVEADLRADVDRNLTIEIIYAQEVVNAMTIPEEEVRKEYEKEKDTLVSPEKVTIIDVYVFKNGDEDSKVKARQLLAMIKAAPGRDPWKLVLDGSFTVRKRALRSDQGKELYDAAKKLQPQDLSGIIDTPSGLHIIKLESYSPEKLLTFDEAKPAIEAKLNVPYREKKTQEWEQELKKGAEIEIIEPDMTNKNSEKTAR